MRPLAATCTLALLATLAGSAIADDASPPALPAASELAVRLGHPTAEDALEEILADVDLTSAEQATRLARALGRTKGHAAIAGLVELLRHPDAQVRATALRAASAVGLRHPRLVRAARDALDDQQVAVRVAAVGAIGRIGDGRDVSTLLARAQDPHEAPEVQAAVYGALRSLCGTTIGASQGRWRAWWRNLEIRDRPAVTQALIVLADPQADHREVHSAIVQRLGWLNLDAVREASRMWLAQENPALRAEACRLVAALRLADLGPAVASARTFDVHRAYRAEADAALETLGVRHPAPNR